uniref:Uncharacterized protein n=1 Tax=Lactuca sativa TaxID=4236 RepID=A0A9R1WFY2_LACSA|nr:hypothetical protein LSAT_V11C200078410 [Lactuca sativa]
MWFKTNEIRISGLISESVSEISDIRIFGYGFGYQKSTIRIFGYPILNTPTWDTRVLFFLSPISRAEIGTTQFHLREVPFISVSVLLYLIISVQIEDDTTHPILATSTSLNLKGYHRLHLYKNRHLELERELGLDSSSFSIFMQFRRATAASFSPYLIIATPGQSNNLIFLSN